jgi:hypothetical protein
MEEAIITIHVLCDELVTALNIHEDPQDTMGIAQVMTVQLTAARFFHGNINQARQFLEEHTYIRPMLSESRLNRRIHAIPTQVWEALAHILATTFQATNPGQEYCLDSFPVPVCDNIRIRQCQLYQGEAYRGYIASKRRYFYGLRVHMLVTASGAPVEFVLRPGAEADVTVFKDLNFDLPRNARCYADKIYNDYAHEALLLEALGVYFEPLRKKNSTKETSYLNEHYKATIRKRIETSFSQITTLFPKSIHAVTARGFELKVICFIFAFSISCLV